MAMHDFIEQDIKREKMRYLKLNIIFGISILAAIIGIIISIVVNVNANTGFTIKEFVYGSLYNSMDTKKYYLAHCEGDIYVNVPETYYSTKIKLDKTEEITWYRVDSSYYKVSNKGWVYNGK